MLNFNSVPAPAAVAPRAAPHNLASTTKLDGRVTLDDPPTIEINGIKCGSSSSCYDSFMGTSVWEKTKVSKCDDDRYELLYTDPATENSVHSIDQNMDFRVFNVNQEGILFSIKILQRDESCFRNRQTDHENIVTDHENIVISTEPDRLIRQMSRPLSELNAHFNSYFNIILKGCRRNYNIDNKSYINFL